MADKVINSENQIWSQTENGVTNIGFTQTFIQEALDQCWHILPANNKHVKEASPLMCLETNDGMLPIFSPCTGDILSFNHKANFPDRLKEDDVVISLGKAPPKRASEPSPPQVPLNPSMWRLDGDFIGRQDGIRASTFIMDDVAPPSAQAAEQMDRALRAMEERVQRFTVPTGGFATTAVNWAGETEATIPPPAPHRAPPRVRADGTRTRATTPAIPPPPAALPAGFQRLAPDTVRHVETGAIYRNGHRYRDWQLYLQRNRRNDEVRNRGTFNPF